MACDYPCDSYGDYAYADAERVFSPPAKPNVLGMEDLWRKPQTQRPYQLCAMDRICPGTKSGANRNKKCSFSRDTCGHVNCDYCGRAP